MTAADARLAALAAALAPARAATLLARGPEGTAAEAARLGALPRHTRLEALSAALATGAPARANARGAAALERPRIASALADLGRGVTPDIAPALLRLLEERAG